MNVNETASPVSSAPKLTAAFALVQAPFWATYCMSVSFAAVYLQFLG